MPRCRAKSIKSTIPIHRHDPAPLLIYELANTQDGITITSDWKGYAIDLNEAWKTRMMDELKEELAKDFDIGKAFEAFQMINAIDVARPVSLAHPMAVDFLIQMSENYHLLVDQLMREGMTEEEALS